MGEGGSSDSDSDDDDANEMDLKSLAETDPEFFSFLQVPRAWARAGQGSRGLFLGGGGGACPP